MSQFPFVQITLAGAFGIDDGRYPVRGATGVGTETPDAVLVVRTYGAPAASRRRSRKQKVRPADRDSQPLVAVTELTAVETTPIDGDPERWLAELRKDVERREALTERGLAVVARALAARRVASADAGVPDANAALSVALRLGYGDGDSLVEGRWGDALEIPREGSRLGRTSMLRPQERMAAIIGGRERGLVCEELILRAGADIAGGRVREATLQVRVGLEAMLAERQELNSASQQQDLDQLEGRRQITGAAANEALQGDLSPERETELRETLATCQRILRRRAAEGA